ncbi:MAG TPA: Gfo/Idh/MocA family oxidoreductase [Candidatus Brocadiia bacterium]|nr:Gfo/Idh/MocA family oxidoreductase [Candidatus Brocadiia bacterium]
MPALKAGIIGCGRMGTAVARVCRQRADIRVQAVCDTDAKRAEILALQYDIPSFNGAQDMVQGGNLDVVFVTTPPSRHVEPVVTAAEAGVHVFCEKPMATTVSDCDRMIEACRRKEVMLTIGHIGRHHPVFAHVKRMVEKKVFGKALSVSLRRLGGGWKDTEWDSPWRYSRHESGGSLLEVNTHELDLMLWLCGPVEEVHAIAATFRQTDADYPDHLYLTAKFHSGALGAFHASQSSATGAYGGQVDCEDGSIQFPNIWAKRPGVWTARYGEPPRFIPAPEVHDATPLGLEINSFIEAVLEGRQSPVTGEEGRAVVQLANAAYSSIQTGKVEKLPVF